MALVKLTESYRKMMTQYEGEEYYKQFLAERHFVYIGEIVNMRGHGVFMGSSGKMYSAFHPQDFEELSEDEI